MLDKNDLVRDTIRMFLSEVQRFEIDNKEEVDDAKALQMTFVLPNEINTEPSA